jgi:hypothetical protein
MSGQSRQRALSYACALVLGVAFVAWLLPWRQVLPLHPLGATFFGDAAQSVIGQRYFLGEPWTWPPLQASRLAWPGGLSVVFTDSIPLILLPLKLLRGLLPPGFYVQQGWLAIAWALQPAAAVYALRSAGERRLLPALAVAVLAISMPGTLARFGQMSLCTHAILLVALGLYFRLVRAVRPREGVATILLLAAALLVHPYLLVMAAALLAAAPLSLLLRRDRRWLPCAAWLGAGAALVGGLAWSLGYGGTDLPGGFGVYSMNLLGPFVPSYRGALPFSIPDPTGGQWFEGYQYLGGGVLLLGLMGAVAVVRGKVGLRRHAGLVMVLVGLFLFSLSGVIYAGRYRLSDIEDLPQILLQFRATGRFFWPVSYAILIGSVAAVMRARPGRRAVLLLTVAVALQLADTARLQLGAHIIARAPVAWTIDAPALAPVLARHDLLTLWPTYGCGADIMHDQAFLDLLLLGSQTLIRTNTMYTARSQPDPICDPQAVLGQPWRPGELRVILPPGRLAERHFVPDSDRTCWSMPPMVLCAQDPPSPSNQDAGPIPTLPLGEMVEHGSALFNAALGEGWGRPEENGIWTGGSDAALRFRLPPGTGEVRLSLEAGSLAPEAGGTQTVQVLANGRPVAEWRFADGKVATMQARLAAGTTVLQMHIDHPTRPVDRGMSGDGRRLGLYLIRLRFDPA